MTKLPLSSAEDLAIPDKELVAKFWRGWIELQLEKKGADLSALTPEIAERIRVATLGMDGDVERVAGEEKMLRRIAQEIAEGDVSSAANLIRQVIRRKTDEQDVRDEAKTGRRKQRALAQKPRSNALQAIIARMVEAQPDITCPGLLAQLRAMADRDDDEVLECDEHSVLIADNPDSPGRSYLLSGLPDRLSRAKKKLRDRSGK